MERYKEETRRQLLDAAIGADLVEKLLPFGYDDEEAKAKRELVEARLETAAREFCIAHGIGTSL